MKTPREMLLQRNRALSQMRYCSHVLYSLHNDLLDSSETIRITNEIKEIIKRLDNLRDETRKVYTVGKNDV